MQRKRESSKNKRNKQNLNPKHTNQGDTEGNTKEHHKETNKG